MSAKWCKPKLFSSNRKNFPQVNTFALQYTTNLVSGLIALGEYDVTNFLARSPNYSKLHGAAGAVQ